MLITSVLGKRLDELENIGIAAGGFDFLLRYFRLRFQRPEQHIESNLPEFINDPNEESGRIDSQCLHTTSVPAIPKPDESDSSGCPACR
jgi:hypothetical protein